MIIDFHAHIFPDALAKRAIDELVAGSGGMYPPISDGTAAGLLKNMNKWGVDVSVIQPVIIKQSQTNKINEWAAAISSERLIAFGGIYPHTDDYKRDIDFVAGLGLRGLKFHPEYQDFVVDCAEALKIYDYALGKGLMIMFHAGADPAFPPPVKSSPSQFARISREMRGGIIIAAHLGGYEQWDEVEKHLAGSDIYLDTSLGFEFFSKEQFLKILKKHGSEKILFGSDAPWSDAGKEIENLKSMPISEDGITAILGGNAQRILKINTPQGRHFARY
jgi:predicted TIM-barrel fold metal-dependent hydrolase